jgi:hypothetical protein
MEQLRCRADCLRDRPVTLRIWLDGNGSRFAGGSKLAAYASLAPVTRQSGISLAGEARGPDGNHRLKNAMFLAAFAALRDPASNLIGRGGVGFKGERPFDPPRRRRHRLFPERQLGMGCPGPCPHPRLEESHRRRVLCYRLLRSGAMPRARCPGPGWPSAGGRRR